MNNISIRKNQRYAFYRFMDQNVSDNYLSEFSLVFWTGSDLFNSNNIYKFNDSARFTGIAGIAPIIRKFDIIKFSVPANIPDDVDYYLGITGAKTTGKANNPWPFKLKILPDDNLSETTGNYTQITKPIFSGNLNIYTSNINENFSIPFIFSGISGFDNINF
jgi:hypothetical protein